MLSFSKENIIVFNGEIYNAKYLKTFINQKNLKGTSDTEILLNLYEKIGPSVLEKIEGMFSFVIYNFKKKIVLWQEIDLELNLYISLDIKTTFCSHQKLSQFYLTIILKITSIMRHLLIFSSNNKWIMKKKLF